MKINEEFLENRKMVRCIDNICRSYINCIGFCNNACHKGFVSIKLLEEHKCREKKCIFLDPIEDHPFWIYIKNKKEQKAKNKEIKNTEKLILEKAKEILGESVELVMCKHLYDSLYLLVAIKTKFSFTLPKEVFKDLHVSVYIKTIFKYQQQNIEYTYERLLPENMRKNLKNIKMTKKGRR